VINIPIALMGAVLALAITGQTVNIMTLGGMALAIGVLVDMSTVVVENIATKHVAGRSSPRRRGFGGRGAVPLLLAMLCVLAVFVRRVLHDRHRKGDVFAAGAGGGILDDRLLPSGKYAGTHSGGVCGESSRRARRA